MSDVMEIISKDLNKLIGAANSPQSQIDALQAKTVTGIFNVVTGYNADNTGVTDSTSAIQSAINAANTAGGGIVYLPPGTYMVKGASGGNFLSLKSNVRLCGSGIGITIIKLGTVTGLSNATIDVSVNATNWGISDLTIDGNNGVTNMQTAITIENGCSLFKIRDIRIENNHPATLGAIYVADATYGKFENIYVKAITTNTHHSIRIYTSTQLATYHKFKNCIVEGGGFGYAIVRASRNEFEHCTAFSTTFTNCLEGFNIDGGDGNVFTDCQAYGRGDAGYIETNIYAGVNPTHNRINGFSAFGNKLTGVTIAGKEGIYSDLMIHNNGLGNVVNQNIGINILNTCSDLVIGNVLSMDTQGGGATQLYGVNIVAGASNIKLNNVHGFGNITSLLNDNNALASKSMGLIKGWSNNNGVNQAIPNVTDTKMSFSTKTFDVGNYFDTVNSRFLPKKAGIYRVTAVTSFGTMVAGQQISLTVRKNGAAYKQGAIVRAPGTTEAGCMVSVMVDLNGSTDYAEVWMYQDSGGALNTNGAVSKTYFEWEEIQ